MCSEYWLHPAPSSTLARTVRTGRPMSLAVRPVACVLDIRGLKRTPVKLIPVLLALASAGLVAAAPPAAPGAVTFTDVTAAAGIKFVHNSGRAGKKYLPETLGSGARVPRRRRRRLARHPADQRQGLDAAAAGDRCTRSTATTSNGTFTERHRRQRPRRRDVRHGRRRRRLRQRRPRRRLHHGARRRPPVPQRGQRQVPRRDQGVRHRQRELRHERRVARLRQGRQARPLRRQLRAVDARRATSGARSTAPPSRTARRSRTRAPRRSCSATSAAASSRT